MAATVERPAARRRLLEALVPEEPRAPPPTSARPPAACPPSPTRSSMRRRRRAVGDGLKDVASSASAASGCAPPARWCGSRRPADVRAGRARSDVGDIVAALEAAGAETPQVAAGAVLHPPAPGRDGELRRRRPRERRGLRGRAAATRRSGPSLHRHDAAEVIDEITRKRPARPRRRRLPHRPQVDDRRQGAEGSPKYVICNADEGDPGAFMDRSVLESDPHRVLEGMAIAAYAVGATEGYIYCRAEYPLAVERLRNAHPPARREPACWAAASAEHDVRLRRRDAPRRRRVRLRRGDRADRLDRRRPGHAAPAPAVSRPRPGCGASRR